MEGYRFKEKQMSIESLFEKIEQLLVEKDSKKAQKQLMKSQRMLTELASKFDGNEIHKLSLLKMTINYGQLAHKISEISCPTSN